MYFDYMGKDYWKQLPSAHSQQQGGNSGVRQESPRQQQNLLSGIPLDAMRNNSNKLVNQDISIEPLEESNKNAENIHAYPHYDCDMGYRRTLRLDKWEITGNRANVITPI